MITSVSVFWCFLKFPRHIGTPLSTNVLLRSMSSTFQFAFPDFNLRLAFVSLKISFFPKSSVSHVSVVLPLLGSTLKGCGAWSFPMQAANGLSKHFVCQLVGIQSMTKFLPRVFFGYFYCLSCRFSRLGLSGLQIR